MSEPTRINLWSGPRNISTALMYSFAQREDTEVVDEPLYAHYLSTTDADEYHPGSAEVLASQENDGDKVIAELMSRNEKEVYFFKHMTHHLPGISWEFMGDCVNLILTRDPRDMLPSFDKIIPNPKMVDVGYAGHLELIEFLESRHIPYFVLDSRSVLEDPKHTLQALCSAIDIPFDPSMLSWESGPRPEDGCWAPHWYSSVHKSTGFAPYVPKEEQFPERLEPLLGECLPIYERLQQRAI